jgi:hypothetical protein
MAVTVAVVEQRRDSKLYPVGGSLPLPERARAIQLAHRARCRDQLSYRQVIKVLADAGIRRSLGQVHNDITRYACERCDPAATAAWRASRAQPGG